MQIRLVISPNFQTKMPEGSSSGLESSVSGPFLPRWAAIMHCPLHACYGTLLARFSSLCFVWDWSYTAHWDLHIKDCQVHDWKRKYLLCALCERSQSREKEISHLEWDKRHTTGQQRLCIQLFRATPTDSGQWSSEPDGQHFHCPLSVGVARNSWK